LKGLQQNIEFIVSTTSQLQKLEIFLCIVCSL
jgi:hypothetical protein